MGDLQVTVGFNMLLSYGSMLSHGHIENNILKPMVTYMLICFNWYMEVSIPLFVMILGTLHLLKPPCTNFRHG